MMKDDAAKEACVPILWYCAAWLMSLKILYYACHLSLYLFQLLGNYSFTFGKRI